MPDPWPDPWYMPGTEGTGEYVVVLQTALARVGYRELGNSCRIRVEPAGAHRSQLVRRFTKSLGWTQPGEGGQNRYSIVVQTEQFQATLLFAVRAIQGELPPIVNPRLPPHEWIAEIIRQAIGEGCGRTGAQLPFANSRTRAEEKMMRLAQRDQVFISYSHDDKRWLDDLQTHLKPYVRKGSITAWSDKQIQAGSKWFDDIKAALRKTKVAVLLVTPSFLASDFIDEHELTPLLQEAEAGGVTILWIPVRASSYQKSPIRQYQSVIEPDKPLAQMNAK